MLHFTKAENKKIKTLYFEYDEIIKRKLENKKKFLISKFWNSEIYKNEINGYLRYQNMDNEAVNSIYQELNEIPLKYRNYKYEQQYILNVAEQNLLIEEYKEFITTGKKKEFDDILNYHSLRISTIIKKINNIQYEILPYQLIHHKVKYILNYIYQLLTSFNFDNIKYGTVELLLYELKKIYKWNYYEYYHEYIEDNILIFERFENENYKNILLEDGDERIEYYQKIYNIMKLNDDIIFNYSELFDDVKFKHIIRDSDILDIKESITDEIVCYYDDENIDN